MTPEAGFWARCAALAGLSIGLALAPLADGALPLSTDRLVVALAISAALLGATAPRAPAQAVGGVGAATVAWSALVLAVAATAGAAIGTDRLAAINGGALRGESGERAEVEGWVTAVPRRSRGEVAVRVQTPVGRLLVRAPEPVPDLDVGAAISATGVLRPPATFERAYLERLGVHRVLAARSIEIGGPGRGGLAGILDAIRVRAQRALSSGTGASAAALLRGFVLGQDDRIAPQTVDAFKRSGLAHLLAVSGQNVLLLAILAAAALSLLGVGLRARLAWTLAAIAVYVLVTGARPSILRAGFMGAAAIVAALADRPRSRWYSLLVAAAATLLIDPRAPADPGWQLSFAAVVGILAAARPLKELLAGTLPGALRGAVAEAVALTTAATLATAPLLSLHFGTVSVVALPANLVAVAAEAPVMWLGMVAATLGQVDGAPVGPVTALAGLLAAYIAQVADWFAAPSWAQIELGLPGVGALLAAYVIAGAAITVAVRWWRRRQALQVPRAASAGRVLVGGVAILACAAGLVVGRSGDPAASPVSGGPARAPGLRVRVLDVGQGDAILLEPRAATPVLVDAGPPGSGVAERLAELGVDELAALIVTHPDSDHAGGAFDVLASTETGRLLFSRPGPGLAAATGAAAGSARLRAGARLRSGELRIRALWPPPAGRPRVGGSTEPNASSLVLLARWHRFRILLTGDAEAELAPVHPGPVDVLKVAHHGSEDAGLERLLEEASPELAVISAGAANPYGHPAAPTLAALAEAGVRVLRTDLDGEVEIVAWRRRWAVSGADDDGGR